MELIHIAAGGIVGFIIGLTGVGGGSLMTPVLVLGFGIPPAIAVGTDLLYAALTKCSGIFFHQKNNTIDWKIVFLLGGGSIPSSLLSLYLLQYLKARGIHYEELMMMTLSIMLILTSLIIMLKNHLLSYVHTRHPNSRVITSVRQFRPQITVLSGLALGFLVTLSSVGAGAIGSAILFLLYPRKKSIAIVGTDLAHAVPLTAIAGYGHLHFGSVDLNLLTGLLIGGIPAIYLGSLIGNRLPDRILRPLIAAFLLLMGIKLAL